MKVYELKDETRGKSIMATHELETIKLYFDDSVRRDKGHQFAVYEIESGERRRIL